MPKRSKLVNAENPSICNHSVAAVFEIFGNPTRLAILFRLLDRPYCVGEIANSIGAKQANISKQLGILGNAGLVHSVRNGNKKTYSVDKPFVKRILDLILKLHRNRLQRRIVELR